MFILGRGFSAAKASVYKQITPSLKNLIVLLTVYNCREDQFANLSINAVCDRRYKIIKKGKCEFTSLT